MRILIRIMGFHVPGFIKKKKLEELFNLTAGAFKQEEPTLKGLSYEELLQQYALFTKDQAERYIHSGQPLEEVKNRLYRNSFRLGQNLRKSLGIVTWNEAVTALQIIYKLIKIDFQCNAKGEMSINQCYFSEIYSGEVCKLISSLDEGLTAGLSGGGKLQFEQRITEGCSYCKGRLNKGELE